MEKIFILHSNIMKERKCLRKNYNTQPVIVIVSENLHKNITKLILRHHLLSSAPLLYIEGHPTIAHYQRPLMYEAIFYRANKK